MTAIAATIAGHRCTGARVQIPSWGCWYADVDVDGEVALDGKVTLQIADLALVGTILSGGAGKGRSFFRIVAGGGGWGKTIPRKQYVTDAGVKLSAVLGDAAREAGELFDTTEIPRTSTVGTSWTRVEDAAAAVLELSASRSWYVDESGITRIGRRPRTELVQKVTHGPVDLARRTVTIASDSIAAIMPGVVVDTLEAVDVEHTLSDSGELRSTIWGARGSSAGLSRRLAVMALLLERLDPWRRFRAVTEYRVVTLDGKLVNLQAVRASTGMPDLRRVPVRPGLAGGDATLTLGSRVLVAFVDAEPSRPVVIGFEETSGAGFAPAELNLRAGAQVGGEHVLTVEALTVILHNILLGIGGLALPPALLGSGIVTGIINAALGVAATPAPLGLVAQVAAAPGMAASMVSGPGYTSTPYAAAIAALASKIPNESGLFPSLGASKVKAG